MDMDLDLNDLPKISCIIKPVDNKGGLYLGDYTSTEEENLK